MKKAHILLVFLLGVTLSGFSQTTAPAATPAPADFWVGKWEFLVLGTPNGDAKFGTTFSRKEGALAGELTILNDPTKEKIAITKIEESADKIVIYFTTSGYDVNLDLSKVDNDNLKGTLMNMFESKGTRIKE